MASWRVNEEAVNSLRKLSSELMRSCENISNLYSSLNSNYEELKDGLGRHSGGLGELINGIEPINKDVAKLSSKLQLKLNRAAMIREKCINENPYSDVDDVGSTLETDSKNVANPTASATGGGALRSTVKTDKQTPEYAPSVDERTIFELESFLIEMEFSDGDTSIIQSGGAHKDVRKIISGQAYESHHIPARSVFSDNAKELPTIALTEEDHAKTSSFRGRMRSKHKPFIPSNIESNTHKENVEEKVDQGLIAEAIKDEIYEIRDAFGEKYDGAIKQYIASMIEYIKKNGTPKT